MEGGPPAAAWLAAEVESTRVVGRRPRAMKGARVRGRVWEARAMRASCVCKLSTNLQVGVRFGLTVNSWSSCADVMQASRS